MARSRLEAFSDGVFAIAITLLVLGLRVPVHGDLGSALVDEWPSFASYLVSFVVIGIIWVNHHAVLDHVTEANRTLLFLNLLLLLWVTFIPFPTALLAEHLRTGNDESLAAAIYSGTMALMGLSFGLLWLYIVRAGLLTPGMTPEQVRRTTLSFVAGNPFYMAAIGISFVSAPLSLAIIAALAVYYILAGRGGGMASPPRAPANP